MFSFHYIPFIRVKSLMLVGHLPFSVANFLVNYHNTRSTTNPCQFQQAFSVYQWMYSILLLIKQLDQRARVDSLIIADHKYSAMHQEHYSTWFTGNQGTGHSLKTMSFAEVKLSRLYARNLKQDWGDLHI